MLHFVDAFKVLIGYKKAVDKTVSELYGVQVESEPKVKVNTLYVRMKDGRIFNWFTDSPNTGGLGLSYWKDIIKWWTSRPQSQFFTMTAVDGDTKLGNSFILKREDIKEIQQITSYKENPDE